jgi:hypothetical protein
MNVVGEPKAAILGEPKWASFYNCKKRNGSFPSSEGAFFDPVYKTYVDSEVGRVE